MVPRTLLVLLILTSGRVAPAIAADDARFHNDVRAAFDVSNLEWADLGSRPRETWAVVRVTPEAYTEADWTRMEAVYPRRLRSPFVPALGVATPVAVLTGDAPDHRFRTFTEPPRMPFSKAPLYERFAPLTTAGEAICRVEFGPLGLGRYKLDPVYLIPDGWAEHVKPVFAYWQADRPLFTEAEARANCERLLPLLRDPNPLQAVLAARTLARGNALAAEDVPDELLAAMDPRGALVTFMLLHHAPAKEDDRLVDLLGRRVATARSAADLRGLALACTLDLARQTDPASPPRPRAGDSRASYRLLLAIHARAAELDPDGRPDPYLDAAAEDAKSLRRTFRFKAERESQRSRGEE